VRPQVAIWLSQGRPRLALKEEAVLIMTMLASTTSTICRLSNSLKLWATFRHPWARLCRTTRPNTARTPSSTTKSRSSKSTGRSVKMAARLQEAMEARLNERGSDPRSKPTTNTTARTPKKMLSTGR